MLPVVRNILIGQLLSYAGLLLCILLRPAGLDLNAGVSYYGIFRETFIPYAFGILSGAYFTKQAADDLPKDETILKNSFKLFALIIFVIVITPYAAGHFVNDVHVTCGTVLFAGQLWLSCWLVRRLHYVKWGVVLVAAEIAVGLLAAIYLVAVKSGTGLLLQTEILYQVTFGTLLVAALQTLHLGKLKQEQA